MKERSERKPVNIDAEVITSGRMFAGVIVNLSENSALVEVPVLHKELDCAPDSLLELRFDGSSLGPIHLPCKVTRTYSQQTTDGVATRLGLKIDHIPSKFTEFLKTLD